MKFPLSTLALVFLLCPSGDAAGLFDVEDGMLDMSQYLAENRYGFLPVPLAITEPAIGYGGGLFGLFLHGKGSREGGSLFLHRSPLLAGPPRRTGPGLLAAAIATPGSMTIFVTWQEPATLT